MERNCTEDGSRVGYFAGANIVSDIQHYLERVAVLRMKE